MHSISEIHSFLIGGAFFTGLTLIPSSFTMYMYTMLQKLMGNLQMLLLQSKRC